MNRDSLAGYLVGLISSLIYLVFVFNNLWGISSYIFLFPLFYFFPSLKDLGIAGLFITGPLIILSILIYPLILFFVAKKMGYKIKFGHVIIGFLLTIAVGNIIALAIIR